MVSILAEEAFVATDDTPRGRDGTKCRAYRPGRTTDFADAARPHPPVVTAQEPRNLRRAQQCAVGRVCPSAQRERCVLAVHAALAVAADEARQAAQRTARQLQRTDD